MSELLPQTSWIERAISLCDCVLLRAAKAHPANPLLRDLAPWNKVAEHVTEQNQNPKSSSTLTLASRA